MSYRPRIILPVGLFLALALAAVLAPLMVAGAVRGFLWWQARQGGFTLEVASVSAPLLRPVVLRQVQLRAARESGFEVDVEIPRAEVGFNLRSILTRSDKRPLRHVTIDGARAVIRRIKGPVPAHEIHGRTALDRLLSDSYRVSHLDLRFENGSTMVVARDLSLTASEIETGSITIAEVAVASPLISRRFKDLRGATSWQNDRLTVGAITLARGIDIDTLTADFSRLASRRLSLVASIDVFGGNVRANIMSDSRDGRRLWDVAGSASDISLAQMSQVLGWRESADGALRTCKFRFRGDASDLKQSTASIWAEVNALAWGSRSADTIMLGASLYNRRLHLDQLYVEQRENELTMSGDSPLSLRPGDWMKPELNADVSADIKDLDAFARLFGARAGEYTGELTLEGALGMQDRELRARLNATGEMQLSNAPGPDGFRVNADVSCNGAVATLRYAELVRDAARFGIWGEIDFGDLRRFTARLFPLEHLADVTAAPSGGCVSSLVFEFLALAEPKPAAEIRQVEVHGDVTTADWNISLRSRVEDQEDAIVRTFSLCPTQSAGELRLTATGSNTPQDGM
ncbi:hypothetical protein BH18VER1_BH18VER1_12480 [soil metagenome]